MIQNIAVSEPFLEAKNKKRLCHLCKSFAFELAKRKSAELKVAKFRSCISERSQGQQTKYCVETVGLFTKIM